MDNQVVISGYEAVMRLAYEKPKWLVVVGACLEEAKATLGSHFAGEWVLKRAKSKGVLWFPNLRPLVAYGILRKEGTSRGGRRAYYSMPDPEGVERALHEIEAQRR